MRFRSEKGKKSTRKVGAKRALPRRPFRRFPVRTRTGPNVPRIDKATVAAIKAMPPESLGAELSAVGSSKFGMTRQKFTTKNGIPFADRYFTKLRYVEQLVSIPSGGAYTNSLGFQSSLYDPNAQTGGAFANYFNNMGQNYLRYIVRGMKITVDTALLPAAVDFPYVVYVWCTPVPYGATEWNTFVPSTRIGFEEWSVPHKKVVVTGERGSKVFGKVSMYAKLSDYFSSPLNYDAFSANTTNSYVSQIGSNPNTMLYFGITCFNLDGGAPGLLPQSLITIDYDCEFFIPIGHQNNTLVPKPPVAAELPAEDMSDSVLVDRIVKAVKATK